MNENDWASGQGSAIDARKAAHDTFIATDRTTGCNEKWTDVTTQTAGWGGITTQTDDWADTQWPRRTKVTDDSVLIFDDGSEITGAELKLHVKVMRKLIAEQYPEELFDV